jgi:hypothetical protein
MESLPTKWWGEQTETWRGLGRARMAALSPCPAGVWVGQIPTWVSQHCQGKPWTEGGGRTNSCPENIHTGLLLAFEVLAPLWVAGDKRPPRPLMGGGGCLERPQGTG